MWEFVPHQSESLWNSFLVSLGVSLLLIRYIRLYLTTVSFLLRYQNDQGRYIHFLHTRQTVFYATNPHLDISQPKMNSWDPVIHQQEKTKRKGFQPSLIKENQRSIQIQPSKTKQDKDESTRKQNHSPKKYQTKQKLYIWYFQTKFNQMVISKQTSKDPLICFLNHFSQKRIS